MMQRRLGREQAAPLFHLQTVWTFLDLIRDGCTLVSGNVVCYCSRTHYYNPLLCVGFSYKIQTPQSLSTQPPTGHSCQCKAVSPSFKLGEAMECGGRNVGFGSQVLIPPRSPTSHVTLSKLPNRAWFSHL